MLETYILTVCAHFWSLQSVPPKKTQVDTCADVTIAALASGHDPTMVLSIAWNESRFIPKQTSSAGAKGPLQVIPRYWCPRKGTCDLVKAGLKAWGFYSDKAKTESDALCMYVSGRKCGERKGAVSYARKVLRTREVMIASLYADWHDRYVDEQCARCPQCCTHAVKKQ